MSGRSRKTNIKKAYAKIKDTLTVKEQAAIETALLGLPFHQQADDYLLAA